MADIKQPQKPGPESGYREQQDPRGQPGHDQRKDGKQLPESADPSKPKPKEPEHAPDAGQRKRKPAG
jgi:hypothetical protein